MTIQDIQALVATRFGVTRLDLISDRRSKAIYRPRQAAMWLCSRLTTHSLAAIGRQFGMRDHTTVSHAIAVVERLMRTDPVFARHVLALLESVDSEESVDVRRAMMWRAAA